MHEIKRLVNLGSAWVTVKILWDLMSFVLLAGVMLFIYSLFNSLYRFVWR